MDDETHSNLLVMPRASEQISLGARSSDATEGMPSYPQAADENAWLARISELPTWQPPPIPTLVIAPHPDDETLGAGGLISHLCALGVAVTVVAVTDGENAYADAAGLREVRQREQTAALKRLGVSQENVHRLHLVDSGVTASEAELVRGLEPLVTAGMHIIAPWSGDPHPDHEACGRAAETLANLVGVPLTSYFFWTWHRYKPTSLDGLEVVSFQLSADERQAKADALACHTSQLQHVSGHPILPDELLWPARLPFEVFLPS